MPDPIGDLLGGLLKFASDPVGTVVDAIFDAIWQAALLLLTGAFFLIDKLTTFDVSTTTGPIAHVWPLTLLLAGLLALGLFCTQVTLMAVRGGRGFLRLITGPVQYGIAVTVGVATVGALVASADAVTDLILSYTVHASNFVDLWQNTSVLHDLGKGVSGVALGLIAIFGVIPLSLGLGLEMLFRQAAILVLVATMPISAAGLLSESTSTWFWRASRWTMAAIFMKPMFALALVLGVAVLSGAGGS